MLRKLDLHHLPFLHFHLYLLVSTCNLPLPFIPPHICILYKSTLYLKGEGILRIPALLSRSVVYDLWRGSKLLSLIFFSLSLSLFINYSPSISSLWPSPSSFHYVRRSSSTRFTSGKWLRVRSLLPLAKRDLIDAYTPEDVKKRKMLDGSRVLRQQGKSITRCSVEGCFS